jgi:tyrosine-protein kinase
LETRGSTVPTLHDYLDILRRRRWIFLQAVAIIPLVAVVLELRQASVYQASAQVLLERQSLGSDLLNINDPSAFDPGRIAKTQAGVARVPEIARRALAAAGVKDRDPSDLLGKSSVSPVEDTDLLVFWVSDSNPKLAARLANEYARAYTQYRQEIEGAALVRALEQVRTRMAALEVSRDTESAIYKSLAAREEQLATLEALQTARAILVRPAGGAAQIEPQPLRTGMLAAIAGVVLGLSLVFLVEALDNRIRTVAKIRELLGLPILGRLSKPRRSLRKEETLVMLGEAHGPQAEAYRMLSTNLGFVNAEAGARTIMVTSAVTAEGKSTTISNLAVALARHGRQAVLVDLDLRAPFLHRFFDVDQRPGFADIALGRVALDECIMRIPVAEGRGSSFPTGNGQSPGGELSVIPAGSVPDDPGDFVAIGQVGTILKLLRERFEIVLIDSSPLLSEGAAMTLSAQVDALLVVTRLNSTPASILSEFQRVLDACPARKLGVVVTDAETEKAYLDRGYAPYRPSPSDGSLTWRSEQAETTRRG